jgi:hypothetical protein
MNAKQQAKVVWFTHRTGASAEEAERFLIEAKWKLEIAIRLRNAHNERMYRDRPQVTIIGLPDD